MPRKKLLVLDLDHTIVYSSRSSNVADFYIHTPTGVTAVQKRPGLDKFLDWAFENYDIGVWTAAGGGYADKIVEGVFHKHRPVFVKHFAHCSKVPISLELRMIRQQTEPYIVVKPLRVLSYPITDILILDDTPETYLRNPRNAVPIKAWFGESDDVELERVKGVIFERMLRGDVRSDIVVWEA
jgi:RNA polymerase II subunit A small phosphatase-like protein